MNRFVQAFFVAVIAVLLTSSANLSFAQNPLNVCSVPAPNTPYVYTDFVNGSGFLCAPAPTGTGTAPTLRVNAAGAFVYWYCPSSPTWKANFVVATTAAIAGSSLVADAYAVTTAKDPLAALNAATRKNVTLPLSDPALTAVWCQYQAEMVANAPIPSAFFVSANGLLPDRAAFAVIAGKRSYGSTQRVKVGLPCDCTSISILEGSTTYCAVAAAVVSVCSKP